MLTLYKNMSTINGGINVLTMNNVQSTFFCNVLTILTSGTILLHIFFHYAHVV